MDLVASIDAWANRRPDRLAHVSGNQRLTFAELRQQSDHLAAVLSDTLPDDRSPVAIIGHKQSEMLVAFLACCKAGHPYVPLDDALPARRIDDVLGVARCGLTLTPEGVREALARPRPAARARPLTIDDTFYMIFTSGSTGTPKGVPITLGCLLDFLSWMQDEQAFREDEVFLNQVPYSFDVSILDTYLSLLTGGTVFAVGRELVADPARLFIALSESDMSVWTSTPAFVNMCLAERRFQQALLPRLRKFFLAGEVLLPSTAARLLERFPDAEVWNMYGPTEATVVVTSVRITPEIIDRYPSLPIGFPKPRTRIDVIGADGSAVSAGTQGEIVIAGPTVSPGYLNPPAGAPAFFTVDGIRGYRTGDRGHYQDGLLFFDGRRDDQIKLHGHRIELGDVEAHLAALPLVRDAVVLPVLKNGAVESLRAFVVTREPLTDSAFAVEQQLRTSLSERLPVHMVPRRIEFVATFPLTVNGKVDRSALAGTIGKRPTP